MHTKRRNLKTACPSRWTMGRASVLLALAGAAASLGDPVVVDVAVGRDSRMASPELLSFTMDWFLANTTCHGGGKCWANASLLTADFADPRLRSAAAHLSPAFLRLGGSAQDRASYKLDGSTCPPEEFCLDRARWDAILDFGVATGLRLVFGLNYHGNVAAGRWDPSAARQLLSYTARHPHGHALAAVELGNEPDLMGTSKPTPSELAAGVSTLRALLHELWAGAANDGRRPFIAGPDVAGSATFAQQFLAALNATNTTLEVLTYHGYCGGSGDPKVAANVLAPSAMDSCASRASDYRALAGAPGRTWQGEGEIAFGFCMDGVCNRWEDVLWYLDHTALVAQQGVAVFARCGLLGGYYEIIDHAGAMRPNPSYWAAILWKQTMGPVSLSAKQAPAVASLASTQSTLRSYAHCGAGNITVLLINLHPSAAAPVTVSAHVSSRPSATGGVFNGEVFTLTSTALSSGDVFLNGVERALELGHDGSLPDLSGRLASTSGKGFVMVTVPPQGVLFLRIPVSAQLGLESGEGEPTQQQGAASRKDLLSVCA